MEIPVREFKPILVPGAFLERLREVEQRRRVDHLALLYVGGLRQYLVFERPEEFCVDLRAARLHGFLHVSPAGNAGLNIKANDFIVTISLSAVLAGRAPMTGAKPVNFIADDAKLGKNVKVWHYAYLGSKTRVGDNVSIGSLAHVDYNVWIGANTRIEGSVYIPPMTRIGKGVFIGPAAVITNDPYPMSKRMVGVTIEDGAVIGGGSVKAGVTVGRN